MATSLQLWRGRRWGKGFPSYRVEDANGEITWVALKIKFKPKNAKPPIGKQERYPASELAVIHAIERRALKCRKPIALETDHCLPVRGR